MYARTKKTHATLLTDGNIVINPKSEIPKILGETLLLLLLLGKDKDEIESSIF
jgi:hypothetical protein